MEDPRLPETGGLICSDDDISSKSGIDLLRKFAASF